jgi:hypothetical protein
VSRTVFINGNYRLIFAGCFQVKSQSLFSSASPGRCSEILLQRATSAFFQFLPLRYFQSFSHFIKAYITPAALSPISHWCSVFLEQLIIPQKIKKFPSLHATRIFITVFTRTRLGLLWDRWIKSTFRPYLFKIHLNVSSLPWRTWFTYLLTYLRSWALLEKVPIVQLLKKFPAFTEPEGSLPCSQEPSTGPYPKPDRSSPYHPISP